jgi:hypothetical protein
VIIYEGHDVPRRQGQQDPKTLDQPRTTPAGTLTQNGLFEQGALRFKAGASGPESVAVYEKIRDGIWAFNGMFNLTDAWVESDGSRKVFKFRLEIALEAKSLQSHRPATLDHSRVIPSAIKLEVWTRDRGCCVLCGEKDNLHFDHDLPYSKGGTSLNARNIRLLCARHNLMKSDKIQ